MPLRSVRGQRHDLARRKGALRQDREHLAAHVAGGPHDRDLERHDHHLLGQAPERDRIGTAAAHAAPPRRQGSAVGVGAPSRQAKGLRRIGGCIIHPSDARRNAAACRLTARKTSRRRRVRPAPCGPGRGRRVAASTIGILSRPSTDSAFFSSSWASESSSFASSSCSFSSSAERLRLSRRAHRGPGIGRVGEMARVRDSRALLFGRDLAIEVDRHARKIRDHRLDLRDAPAAFVDLEAFEPDEVVPRLHHSILQDAEGSGGAVLPECVVNRETAASLPMEVALSLPDAGQPAGIVAPPPQA